MIKGRIDERVGRCLPSPIFPYLSLPFFSLSIPHTFNGGSVGFFLPFDKTHTPSHSHRRRFCFFRKSYTWPCCCSVFGSASAWKVGVFRGGDVGSQLQTSAVGANLQPLAGWLAGLQWHRFSSTSASFTSRRARRFCSTRLSSSSGASS